MNLKFKIGPAVIGMEADDPPWRWPDPLHSLFEYDGNDPISLLIRIQKNPFGVRENGKLIAESTDEWRLYQEKEGYRFEAIEKREFQARACARISSTWDRVDYYREPPSYYPPLLKTRWGIGEVMSPLVPWWLTGWLAESRLGLIFHGAAVACDGMGLAFVAPSGGGKSTLAALCRYDSSLTLMNDERIVIWRNSDGWQLASTPWHGLVDQVRAVTVPLRRLFLLKKAPENSVTQPVKETVFEELIQQVFLPLWDLERMEGLIATVDLLMKEIETEEFHFVNHASAVDYLREIAERSTLPISKV